MGQAARFARYVRLIVDDREIHANLGLSRACSALAWGDTV